MKMRCCLLLLLFFTLKVKGLKHDGSETTSEFSNEWIVHLEGDDGEGEDAADRLAAKLGYENRGEVGRKVCHP